MNKLREILMVVSRWANPNNVHPLPPPPPPPVAAPPLPSSHLQLQRWEKLSRWSENVTQWLCSRKQSLGYLIETRSLMHLVFRMFCTFLQSLNIDGSAMPLLLVLYIVLCTHVCIWYTSCTSTGSGSGIAGWSTSSSSRRRWWFWLSGVLAIEVAVTFYGVMTSNVYVILEVIGIAIIQTLISVVYFLVSEEKAGGASKRCVNPNHHHHHCHHHHHHPHHHLHHHHHDHQHQDYDEWRLIVQPSKLRNSGG